MKNRDGVERDIFFRRRAKNGKKPPVAKGPWRAGIKAKSDLFREKQRQIATILLYFSPLTVANRADDDEDRRQPAEKAGHV